MISISEKRPLKGSSLVALPLDYVALDIETTGLSPTFDEIIELSAVRVRGGKPVAEYTRLVKPSAPLDPYVSELTGITDEILESAAPIAAELPAFFDFVAADVIVGHSVAYDVNFLYDSAERCGLSVPTNDYVDTLRLSRRLYADLPDHKLATVAQYLGVNQLPEHRGLADALAAAQCLEAMRQHVESDGVDLAALFKSHSGKSGSRLDLAALVAEGEPDETSPLFGKVCVFTGALDGMTRAEAAQAVVNIGGSVGNGVTKKTDFLVVGSTDYCASVKGGKTGKLKKAEDLQKKGANLAIIDEGAFYDMLGE